MSTPLFQFMMLMMMRSTLSSATRVTLSRTGLLPEEGILQSIMNFAFGPKEVIIESEEEWNTKVKQLPQAFDGMKIIPTEEIRFEEILQALKEKKIANLDLSEYVLSEENCLDLAEELKKNQTLTNLDVCPSENAPECARAIGAALETNSTLKSLYLANSNIGSEGAKAIAKGLEKNLMLKEVSLGNNNIRSEGAKAIGDALIENQSLQILYLDGTNIGDDGAKSIAKGLEKNLMLKDIFLGMNFDISGETIAMIKKLLDRNKTPTRKI